MRKVLYILSVLVGIYLLMLLRWGYEFGRNDQMQVLAYAKLLQQPGLYPEDFYLQGIHESIPNERYIFSRLLSFTGEHLEAASLLGHIFFALLMLYLLYRISSLFILNKSLRWLGILIVFIPLYGINLGGNELYYNTLHFSNVVKTIGMGGVWFMLTRNYIAAFSLFALATFIQPVVGLQLFACGAFILIAGKLTRSLPLSWPALVMAHLIYLFTAGVWVLLLRSHFEADMPASEDRFFQILFVFRSPHHYLPSAYPLKSWFLLLPLFVFSTLYYRKHNTVLYLFHLAAFLACASYVVAMEVFQSTTFGAIQLFKTTIWIKAFSVIAVMAWLDQRADWLHKKWVLVSSHGIFYGAAAASLFILWAFPHKIPMDIPLDFGQQYTQDPAVKIAREARKRTPEDALFIHPIMFTELKYYGERSSYVDYKPLVHKKVKMHEWHERIKRLYGIGYDMDFPEDNRFGYANDFFKDLEYADLMRFKKEGITHIITFDEVTYPLELLAKNEEYKIYIL